MGRLIRLSLTVPQTRALLHALDDGIRVAHSWKTPDHGRLVEIRDQLEREAGGRLVSDAEKMKAHGGRYPAVAEEEG